MSEKYAVFVILILSNGFCPTLNSNKFNLGANRKRDCPYPVLRKNGSEISFDTVGFIGGIAEVKFNGAFDKVGAKRYCKIKCVGGEWVGPLCLLEGEKLGSKKEEGPFYPVLKSCSTKIFRSKFIVSHRNQTVWESRNFSHNAVVQVRCKQFGVYKLIGDAHLVCHNGIWKHRIPTCVPTTSLTNYTDESAPPSVLAKIISGSASIEPTGELAVYPGSTVHLECLYLRSAGEPEWSWTSTYRSYVTGWSIDPEERQRKFRLSIFYIKPQDTGIYTCSTPRGLTHSIILNVVEVHCEVAKVLTNDPNVLIQIQGSRLGQTATYQCREGFKLNGAPSVTCQASGQWSGNPPECVPIVCPTLNVENKTVKLIKQDSGYGGAATFKCPPGQKLIGIATLRCLLNGEWSAKVPTCKEVYCPPPLIPQNGMLKYGNDSAALSFRVGSELTFSCINPYTLIGKETIKCDDSGMWSNPPPFCKAYCLQPGDPPNGNFGPRKILFEIGERISLVCNKGYELSSKIRPKCLKNGTWSDLSLECQPKKTFRTFDKTKMGSVVVIQQTKTTSALLNSPAPIPTTASNAIKCHSSNNQCINSTIVTTDPTTITPNPASIQITVATHSNATSIYAEYPTTATETTTTPNPTTHSSISNSLTQYHYTFSGKNVTFKGESTKEPIVIDIFHEEFNFTEKTPLNNDTDFFYVSDEQPNE